MIGLVLTSLDLSDSSFGDADCKAIKDLRFLTVLNIERCVCQLFSCKISALISPVFALQDEHHRRWDSTPHLCALRSLSARA